MTTALAKIQALHDGESDTATKAELRRALDILKRSENATAPEDKVDMRDPNYKQVANEPDAGPNAFAERNRTKGPLPETIKGTNKNLTPPPAEAEPLSQHAKEVQVDKDGKKVGEKK